MHAFVRFIRLAALAMIVSPITVLPVHADFDSGQTAWDGGDVARRSSSGVPERTGAMRDPCLHWAGSTGWVWAFFRMT